MSEASSPIYDPYADTPPAAWRKYTGWFWAGGAFLFTVLLTVVAFPPFKAGEFAYAFAVPAILWAYRKPGLKIYALTMLAAQAVAWTILLGWLHHVTWAGLFLLGPFVGAWIGLWYLAVWWAMPRMVGRPTPLRLAAMLGLAGLWVIIEWSRTWLFGGFPWLPLAASQWQQVSVLQIASYTGAGGISFVLIGANLGFAAYANRLFFEGRKGFNRRSQEFFLAMFLLIVCLAIHVSETTNRGQFLVSLGRIALVQPHIPQTLKWDETRANDVRRVVADTTAQALKGRKPDVIFWPEAVTPSAVLGDPQERAWVENIVASAGVSLFMGSVAVERMPDGEAQWKNGAFVVDPVEGVQPAWYAKRRLVPFGEYVPFRPLLGWLSKVTDVGEGDFVRGESATPLLITAPGRIFSVGPLICYEDVFPQLARESVQSGAEVLAVITNNGWFGEGGAAYQHAAHSVLRAVEMRRPVIRCGNGGWSGWIDEFGKIRAVMTNPQGSVYFRGAATFEVTRDSRWIEKRSVYSRFGDWFVAMSLALAAIGAGALRLKVPTETPASEVAVDD